MVEYCFYRRKEMNRDDVVTCFILIVMWIVFVSALFIKLSLESALLISWIVIFVMWVIPIIWE